MLQYNSRGDVSGSGTGGFTYTGSPIVCIARTTTAQSVPSQNVPYTILALELEDYDTDGMHDLVTNNERITITNAGNGAFEVTASVVFSSIPAKTHVGMYIGKNVVIGRAPVFMYVSQNTTDLRVCTTAIDTFCSVGDYFNIHVAQVSGSTATVASARLAVRSLKF